MKIMTYNGDREYYIKVINFLKDMKIAFGPAEVKLYLRRHKGIEKYLRDRMRSYAHDLDIELQTLEF